MELLLNNFFNKLDRKYILPLFGLIILIGIGSSVFAYSKAKEHNQLVLEQVAAEEASIEASLQEEEEAAEAEPLDYQYYMVNDPDISSEVMPMDGADVPANVLLLTFDDGPNEHTLETAKQLAALDVGAIFLINGMYLDEEENREILKEVYDMGFEIGNHTQHHENLRELDYESQQFEISETSRLIEEVTGEKPRWFRPSFGQFNMDTINICNDLDMQLMTWNFGYDWMEEYHDAALLTEISVDNSYLRDGANVLMHDLPWTSEAITDIVNGYHDQGYYIVNPKQIKSSQNSTDPLETEDL